MPSSSNPEIPKTVIGALFLLLRELLPHKPSTVAAMLDILGVGKSQCYELKERLRETLPELLHSPGRPSVMPEREAELATLKACYAYTTAHLGAVRVNHSRRQYSDGFRNFMIDLVAPGGPAESLSLECLAELSDVPLGTLKSWLAVPARKPLTPEHAEPTTTKANPDDDQAGGDQAAPPIWLTESALSAQVKTILTVWPSWEGSFKAFCQAMSTDFRIQRGPTFIGNILQVAGLRERQPRKSKEAPWSRGTFRTHFPGAQWLGDGTNLAIVWNGKRYVFNIETLLDATSNAVVGFAVTDSESADALGQAFDSSLETTQGIVPLAVTLDNKPCNTCEAAATAVGGAIVLLGTPGRGQSKAALEGAFGLFAQAMPALAIEGGSDREMARSALRLVLTAWHRGRNGRPRKRFQGKSPAQVFLESCPTHEDTEAFLKWAQELWRQQEAYRLTREARLDPQRLETLRIGLLDLAIPDPDDRLAKALARFCRDSISRGLATFESKRDNGTVPPEAHRQGAYLGGIIANLHTQLELERFAVHLMKQRLRARDLTLEPLARMAAELRANASNQEQKPGLVKAFLQRALEAPYKIDFLFWAKAITDTLVSLPESVRAVLCETLVRRVAKAFATDRDRRADLIDRLVSCVALSTAA